MTTLTVWPLILETLALSPLQVWLMAGVIVVFFSILATLLITCIFSLPYEQFQLFLKNTLKKNKLPPSLPFRAVPEIETTYITFQNILANASKNSETLRKAAEYDEIRYRLITTITHRLRTPVTGLTWALNELTERNIATEAEDKKNLEGAVHATKIMNEIIETLLKTVQAETEYSTSKKESIEVLTLIESIMQETELLARSKHSTITIENKMGAIPTLEGNREQLHFALQNVISNAIYYSLDGGTITIVLERSENSIHITIRDDGVGIPREEQSHLFERFSRGQKAFTMNTEGTGLGLYVTKDIITNHHGEILLESAIGKGTTVMIKLPIRGTGELETFIAH